MRLVVALEEVKARLTRSARWAEGMLRSLALGRRWIERVIKVNIPEKDRNQLERLDGTGKRWMVVGRRRMRQSEKTASTWYQQKRKVGASDKRYHRNRMQEAIHDDSKGIWNGVWVCGSHNRGLSRVVARYGAKGRRAQKQ